MLVVGTVGSVVSTASLERAAPTPRQAPQVVPEEAAIAEVAGSDRTRETSGRVVQALFEAERLSAEPVVNPSLFFVENAEEPIARSPMAALATANPEPLETDDGPLTGKLLTEFYSNRQTFVESVAGTWGYQSEANRVLVADFDQRVLKLRVVGQRSAGDEVKDATLYYISADGDFRGSISLSYDADSMRLLRIVVSPSLGSDASA